MRWKEKEKVKIYSSRGNIVGVGLDLVKVETVTNCSVVRVYL